MNINGIEIAPRETLPTGVPILSADEIAKNERQLRDDGTMSRIDQLGFFRVGKKYSGELYWSDRLPWGESHTVTTPEQIKIVAPHLYTYFYTTGAQKVGEDGYLRTVGDLSVPFVHRTDEDPCWVVKVDPDFLGKTVYYMSFRHQITSPMGSVLPACVLFDHHQSHFVEVPGTLERYLIEDLLK